MKKLTILIAMLIAIGGCSNEVPYDQLLYRDGLYYEVNSQTPFRGSSVRYYESGQLKSKANYKWGKRHGFSEWYYENGQLQSKRNWQYGYEDGLAERYLENGSKEP